MLTSLFKRSHEKTSLREKLSKPRNFFQKLGALFSASKISDDDLDDIEDQLFLADVGVEATTEIVDALREEASQGCENPRKVVKEQMVRILRPCETTWQINAQPYVIVMVGVNGVGKTTTSAKIAARLQQQGYKLMFAAADTFRAAAVEQLKIWGDKLNIPVIAHAQGGDPAAVAHDAYQAAVARNADILIVDTAGRQHTQDNLMGQLQKVVRVLSKLDSGAPHETVQVLDATTGQNAVSQLSAFKQAVPVDSLCLTKLDGTAKGGILFALTNAFSLPVRYIGVGESTEDLIPFEAETFVDALLPEHGAN